MNAFSTDQCVIQTHSGIAFDIMNPTVEMVSLDDIAHALSNICRFNGQLDRFYSVAEHCVHTASLAPLGYEALWLMHDAHEAYIGDIASPLKRALGPWIRDRQNHIQSVIHKAFGMHPGFEQTKRALKQSDLQMLSCESEQGFSMGRASEWSQLSDIQPAQVELHYWAPDIAKQEFLAAARGGLFAESEATA